MKPYLFLTVLVGCQGAESSTPTMTQQVELSCGDWSTPINVGPPINTQYNDSYAILDKDELAMYFTSDRPGGKGGDDLWVSRRLSRDSPWGDPVNLAMLNSASADSLAVLDDSGYVMYFHSNRTDLGGCGKGDLWMSRRTNRDEDDWSAPVNLGCVINTPDVEIAPAFFSDPGTHQVSLYFGSDRPGGKGGFDIYQSFLPDGCDVFDVFEDDKGECTFGPGIWVPELSSPSRDTRTFVRRDGHEVFITSDRPSGQGGLDIWVSTRNAPSDPWNVPTNLGAVVNSSADEGSPFLSRGKLFFFSNRPGGYGARDIWVTTRDCDVD